MAYKNIKIKDGMGGSRNGKSRWEKTGVLKLHSKTLRRWLDKQAVKEQQEEGAESKGRAHLVADNSCTLTDGLLPVDRVLRPFRAWSPGVPPLSARGTAPA